MNFYDKHASYCKFNQWHKGYQLIPNSARPFKCQSCRYRSWICDAVTLLWFCDAIQIDHQNRAKSPGALDVMNGNNVHKIISIWLSIIHTINSRPQWSQLKRLISSKTQCPHQLPISESSTETRSNTTPTYSRVHLYNVREWWPKVWMLI